MGCIRRTGVVALVLVGVLAATACSDDGDDRSDPARSSRPATSTTAPERPTTPPENPACELVTQVQAEAVFGDTARAVTPEVSGGADAVCEWRSAGEPEQILRFSLYERSDVATNTLSNAPINITVQRSTGGRTFAFAYLAHGGDADAKGAAVNDLADSVVARAGEGG
jgi:hypothetical protein